MDFQRSRKFSDAANASLGHVSARTSVDQARKQTYQTTPIVGNKRGRTLHTTTSAITSEKLVKGEVVLDSLTHLPPNDFRAAGSIRNDSTLLKASAIRDIPNASRRERTNSGIFHSSPRTQSQSPSRNPLLSLSHPRYRLPPQLISNIESLGIKYIYQWQSSCLLGRDLLAGEKNLVYTAPTGGGKSLVADILMLKNVIDNPGKKAILVLPYVALVQEKTAWLRRVVEGVRRQSDLTSSRQVVDEQKYYSNYHHKPINVVGFFGGSKTRETWSDTDIAVCTIEKANSLINGAIEECSVDKLGVVVLDELHMLDDNHRGYILELLATKLLILESGVQIIGMSATLSVRGYYLTR
jgi:DEAD/DEAH box helicase